MHSNPVLNCDRASRLALSRLASSQSLSFLEGRKIFAAAQNIELSKLLLNTTWTVWDFPERTYTLSPCP